MIEFTIHKDNLLNSNQRLHYMQKAQRTRDLRNVARIKGARALEKREVQKYGDIPVDIVVDITKSGGRFDAPNFYPTVKAIIDGFVDCGILDDDSNKYVASVTFHGETDKSIPRDVVKFTFQLKGQNREN